MKTTTYQKAPKVSPVPGVEITIIGNTDRVMLTYITAQPGAVIPSHAHPHDQVGTCVQGEGELVSGNGKHKTIPGTAWTIPGGEAHDWKNTGTGVAILIETFCPPREDYLAKAK
jgi:quercetin dioxygenase-like cupin family protein